MVFPVSENIVSLGKSMQQTILLTVDCSMSEDLEQKLIE
jgi:hypothetical protein